MTTESIIPELIQSKWNHGDKQSLIATCNIPIEVAFQPEAIMKLLSDSYSDSVYKTLNALAECFQDESANCYAVKDLSGKARRFFKDMVYFIEQEELREVQA